MSMYLKIKSIQGNVTTKNYENSIQIFHYDLSSFRSINKHPTGTSNRTAGLVRFNSLTFSKEIDRASVDLWQHFYGAKVISEMQFCHVSTGENPQCYLVNTVYDALIHRYNESHSHDSVIETLEIKFSRFEKRNMPLDKNLRPSTPKTVGYDLVNAAMV